VKDLFLCHSGRDDEWVEALGARLEAETSNGRPLEVFVDRWDIDYGENILTRITAVRLVELASPVMHCD